MLHILWIIIKGILLLLGILLSLILASILLVLFCPVRYSAAAEKIEEDFKKTKLYVSVSWLFHGISFKIRMEEGTLSSKILLFGIPLDKFKRRKKKRKVKPLSEKAGTVDAGKSLKQNKKETPKESVKHAQEIKRQDVQTQIQEEKLQENLKQCEEHPQENILQECETQEHETQECKVQECALQESETQECKVQECVSKESETQEHISQEHISQEKQEVSEEDDEAHSVLVKIKEILALAADKLKRAGNAGSMMRKIGEKFSLKLQRLQKKIQKVLDQWNWWKSFLGNAKVKAAISCVKKELWKTIKHIFPKKLKGKITFGCEDPSVTGTVLAVLGMTMPLHKNCVEVTPLFDGTNMFQGTISFKGRIYAAVLLLEALKVIVNKNVRYTIKYWKNKEES